MARVEREFELADYVVQRNSAIPDLFDLDIPVGVRVLGVGIDHHREVVVVVVLEQLAVDREAGRPPFVVVAEARRRGDQASFEAEVRHPVAKMSAIVDAHAGRDMGVDQFVFVDFDLNALGLGFRQTGRDGPGRERRIDLAEVNGRVFVNNVSLGLYAEAVQREGYREAKLRTILDTVADVLGPEGKALDLRWTGPGGHEHSSGAAILVSNNRYRLGHAVGSGTRPRIDDELLGVTVAASPTGGRRLFQRPWREWSTPEFEVDGDGPIAAGIDGEALTLDPPLHLRIIPGALRVRIAAAHPGASPSAAIPEGAWEGIRVLARIATGRIPSSQTLTKEN